MEDDMVADATLWVIVAAAMAFIAWGCWMTRPAPKVADDAHADSLDQAV